MDEKLLEQAIEEFGSPVSISEVTSTNVVAEYEITYKNHTVRISFPDVQDIDQMRTMTEFYASAHEQALRIVNLEAELALMVQSFYTVFEYFARVTDMPMSKTYLDAEERKGV